MFYYMPTKVYQEEACVQKHGKELAGLGHKALIVTGRSSAAGNGSLKDVTDALDAYGTAYCIFNKVEENPSIETIMEARDYGIAAHADYVIGIGGGSPLDAAKAIALMMENADSDETLLYEKVSARALPVAEIPTTCGTGSEVTPYAILTIHGKRTKSSLPHRIYPSLALIDGKYLEKIPHHILSNTAVDALGHMIESYCNSNATDYSRMLCAYAMEVWARSRDAVAGSRAVGKEDRENLMMAAAMAGMAITHTGTSLPHALSYKITYEKGTPHGKAIGVFLASYLAHADENDRLTILNRLGMKDIEELRDFVTHAVGTVEVEQAFLEEMVQALLQNTAKLKNCPYVVDETIIKQICTESCTVQE